MKRNPIIFVAVLMSILLFNACCDNDEEMLNEEEIACNEELFTVIPYFKSDECTDPEEISACSQQQLLIFIYSNLIYPQEAIDNMVEGDVAVQFVIGLDGQTKDHQIIDSVGSGCDAESIRIAKLLCFTAGKNECNDDAEVNYTLYIKFKL